MGEIQIYYRISVLILQKSWKGKCLNTLGSNSTPSTLHSEEELVEIVSLCFRVL